MNSRVIPRIQGLFSFIVSVPLFAYLIRDFPARFPEVALFVFDRHRQLSYAAARRLVDLRLQPLDLAASCCRPGRGGVRGGVASFFSEVIVQRRAAVSMRSVPLSS
jgi:hypothetical protein